MELEDQIDSAKTEILSNADIQIYVEDPYIVPPWTKTQLKLNIELANMGKNETAIVEYQQKFQEIVENKYKNNEIVYTDGSKSDDGVSSAFFNNTSQKSFKLNSISSIFTAELHGIQMALLEIANRSSTDVLLCTDSLSAVKYLKKNVVSHPIAVEILKYVNSKSSTITIMWIPSHSGIKGNNEADRIAKQASTNSSIDENHVTFQDFKKMLSRKIKENFDNRWNSLKPYENHLRMFKDSNTPWSVSYNLKRNEIVKFHRIATGHSNISQKFKLTKNLDDSKCPICTQYCTTRHMLIECQSIQPLRNQFLQNKPLHELIQDDPTNVVQIYKFLEAANLLNLI